MNDKSQVNIFGLRLSRRNIKRYIVKYTSDVITRDGRFCWCWCVKNCPFYVFLKGFLFFFLFFDATYGKFHERLYSVHMVQHVLFRSLFKNRRITSQTLVLTLVKRSG